MATSADLAALEAQIGTMIGQQETGNGTAGVGVSLNNPGAIKYAPDQVAFGAVQAPSGFAQFPTLAQGRAAMQALIDKYVKSGNSISTLINSWAPPSDNNTNNDQRISQIASVTGLNPQLPITSQAVSGSSAPAGGLQGAWDSVWGTNGGKGLGSTITDEVVGTFPWGRTAAGLAGLICLGIGLLMLSGKGQVVVEQFKAGVKEGAAAAAL
jgi:hypothetical protein